jgi:hypothetical protein
MGTFPKSEDAILAAAQELIGGLTDNPTIFRKRPVNPMG